MVWIFNKWIRKAFAYDLKVPKEIYAKVEYKKMNKIAYYSLGKDKICLNERLFQNPKDPDGKYHDIILRHEYRHFLAKKNYIKHILIDLIDALNPQVQKANASIGGGKLGLKIIFYDMIPIHYDREAKVWNVSITTTFLYFLILLILVFR